MKLRLIVNPRAGAGASARKIPAIKRTLATRGLTTDIVLTRGPGDATVLARQARTDGVDVLVAVGGDGTLNEIVQAYLNDDGTPVAGPALAMIPAGTGGDFRRALDLDKDATRAVSRILDGEPRPLDFGAVEVLGDRGEPVRRAFVNIASFGVSGKIDRLVNQSPKWMGGRLAFAIGTVRAMSTYRNERVTIEVDGQAWFEGRVVVVAVANGQYFGGGMRVAPEALTGDGLLDVVAIGDLSFEESLRMSPDLYAGRHLANPRVRFTRGRSVVARPAEGRTVYVDTDGETPGRLPLSARVFPGGLVFRG